MALHPRTSPHARPGWRGLNDSPVDDFLRRVNLFAKAVQSGVFAGWGLAIAVAIVLGAVLSDAFFAWPTAVRIAINVAAIAAAGFAGMVFIWRLLRSRYDARRLARFAEERLQRGDSLLINAVEFRSGIETGSERLRESVVRSADGVVAELGAAAMTPASPVIRATLAGVAAAVAFGIAVLVAPRLFATVLPRFLDPTGDHPPFTLLSFQPTVTPDPLHRGRPALVSVEITGPELVEEATLVVRPIADPQAKPDQLPMFRQSETTFSAQIARVDVDSQFHIETARGRSEKFLLKVSDTPLIEDVRARLTFPDYTGWKPREQGLDERGLRGMKGTTVTLRVRSNLPLAGGEVRVFAAGSKEQSPAEVVPLTVAADGLEVVQGGFTIERTGRFEIVVKTSSGRESEILSGPLVAIPDRPPQVAITSPAATIIAVEGWKVPVEIQASDDVGINRVRLFRGVNGWSPVAITLPHETDEGGVVLARSEFDLETLGARAGDVITYYASADERVSSRPQSTDTPSQTIQVISEEEYKDFARQQYQLAELTEEFESFQKELERLNEERQKAAEQLEELLRKQAAGEPLTAEDREQMERLEKQLREFAKDTAELAKTLEERASDMQLYDLEQQYTEELQKLSKELSQQFENAERVAELLKQQQASSSEKLTDELKEAAEQFEKESGPFDAESQEQLDALAEDLETLQKADALNEQVERLQAAATQQRELANRMAELAGKTTLTPDEQARADRFAKEQELLAQEMESIQKDLADAAKEAEEKLPQMAESAQKLSQMLSELAIPQEQLAAAQQAREQQGDAAHQHAETAARKLESLMKAAGQVQESQGLQEGLDGPLSLSKQQLRNSLQQMRRGRRPPGLGQRKGGQPGQGQADGDGQGGSSAGGQPGQNQGRLRPGQSSPRGDSDAQVMGPRTQEAVESSDKSATMQADAKGRFVLPGVSGEAPSAESLTPTARSSEGLSGPSLRGVPVGYRDAAEAYLRRLSEERRSK